MAMLAASDRAAARRVEPPQVALVKQRERVPSGFQFGSKAETLFRLKPVLRQAKVPDLVYFPVSEWAASRNDVLDRIADHLGRVALAVRSSALAEDGAKDSLAGVFESCLDVDGADPRAVAAAIRYRPREAYRGLLQRLEMDRDNLVNLSDEMLDSVIHLGSFEHQSGGRIAEGREDAEGIFRDGGPVVARGLRKGIKGDWKNHFTPAVVSRVKEVAGEGLIELGYERDLDW